MFLAWPPVLMSGGTISASGVTAIQIPLFEKEKKVIYRFEQSHLDPCVFVLRKWEGGGFSGRPVAYMGCHVDDLLIAAPRDLQGAIQEGLSAAFPIEDWEMDDFEFLGSRIVVADEEVTISQEKYATTRLFQLDIPSGHGDDEIATEELISDNRSLIGALSWMSSTSRPDLTCSVSMAQQLQKQPTYADLRFTNATAAKALLYKDHGFTFKYIPPERMMVIVYHDAAWANVPEADPLENHYVLTPDEDLQGLQKEGPFVDKEGKRKAKKGNSKVASQLGILVTFADRGCLSGEPGNFSIADWKSRAGQRVCRSTFGAESQACAEGLETAQYIRSMFESIATGELVTVERAKMPLLCLSDCRSLFDHLNKQGIPRVPTDKRLAVDLAAIRQGLRSEVWGSELPIGWIPGVAQRADVLTKPQNPSGWWEACAEKLLLPLALGQEKALICDRKITERTSVKLEGMSTSDCLGLFPYEHTGSTKA